MTDQILLFERYSNGLSFTGESQKYTIESIRVDGCLEALELWVILAGENRLEKNFEPVVHVSSHINLRYRTNQSIRSMKPESSPLAGARPYD